MLCRICRCKKILLNKNDVALIYFFFKFSLQSQRSGFLKRIMKVHEVHKRNAEKCQKCSKIFIWIFTDGATTTPKIWMTVRYYWGTPHKNFWVFATTLTAIENINFLIEFFAQNKFINLCFRNQEIIVNGLKIFKR